MILTLPVFLIGAAGLFVIGTVIGSFINLCASRIPWEQSVVWPGSRCDGCGAEVGGRDLIPIVGWIGLKGKARCCGASIPGRYPFVELLTATLFVFAFASVSVWASTARPSTYTFWATVAADVIFITFMMIIALVDFDLTIVPPPVTNLGIVAGLLFGLIAPGFRPEPCTAQTALGGLAVGLTGMVVGAAIVWFVRMVGGIVFRREAMGSGDIHILAVVGAFLGWRVAVLTFFLSSFYGLIPSVWKLIPFLWKWMTGRQWKESEHEIPLGPFLAMAAVSLMLAWPWLWPLVFKSYFAMIESILTDAPAPGVEN